MRQFVIGLFVCQCLFGVDYRLYAFNSDSTQRVGYQKSIDLYYELGSVLPTNDFVRGLNPNEEAYRGFQALSLKYSIHTDGRQDWEQLYAYPVWGVGLYQGFFMNDYGQLGHPGALYLFLDLPLKRWEKWSLHWEMGLGLSYNWKTYELNDDPYTYPISTSNTIFLDLGLNAQVPLGKHLNLKAGLTVSHFSNGGMRIPNEGINVAGARLELQYLLHERSPQIYREIPAYQKEWEWIALIAPAKRQVGYNYVTNNNDTLTWTKNCGALNLSSTLNRQISHKVKFGAGTDLCYNEAYGSDTIMINAVPTEAPYRRMDKMLIGVYGSFELVLGKFSMIVQPGYYLYKREVEKHGLPSAYQRVGIKYHIRNNLVAGISIRTLYFSKAEYIEWNMGYRLKWHKK